MEVTQVLHMNGGTGKTSYANNSLIQRKAISLTKSIIEEAISCLYKRTLLQKLVITDLGCSSGPNALFVITLLIKAVEKICRELNRESPEYHVFLSDLPSNDFNNLFKSLDSFKQKLSSEIEGGGIIKKQMDGFNIPNYTPSPSELKQEIVKEAFFTMNRLQVSEVSWKAACGDEEHSGDYGYKVAQSVRAAYEPLVVTYFGKAVVEHVFRRYQDILADRMSKEITVFIELTTSITRTSKETDMFLFP